MKTSLIVARSIDNIIGIDGKLPWHCPEDLALFKEITSGPKKAVIMGRNTWESLPVKPLPGRLNIVVSSKPGHISSLQHCSVRPSIEMALELAKEKGMWEAIFIGGKKIYEAAVDIVDEVHLMEMNEIYGDAYDNITTFDYNFDYFKFSSGRSWDSIETVTVMRTDARGNTIELFDYHHLKRIASK